MNTGESHSLPASTSVNCESNRRLPIQHLPLCHLQQIIAVLRQQVQRMGNVWNVLNIAMPEAHAMQGFEQVAAGADALDGGLEDVLGVGLGVDDHWRAVGDAAVERVIAVWKRI